MRYIGGDMIARRHVLLTLTLLMANGAWAQTVVSPGNPMCTLGSWASVELGRALMIPAGDQEICRTDGTIAGSRGSGSHQCCFRDVPAHSPESAGERRERIAEHRQLLPSMVAGTAGGAPTRRTRETDDHRTVPIPGYSLIAEDAARRRTPLTCTDSNVSIRFEAVARDERGAVEGSQTFELECRNLSGVISSMQNFSIESMQRIFPEIVQISGAPPRTRVGTRRYGGKKSGAARTPTRRSSPVGDGSPEAPEASGAGDH